MTDYSNKDSFCNISRINKRLFFFLCFDFDTFNIMLRGNRLFLFFWMLVIYGSSQPAFQWVKNTEGVGGRLILDPLGNMIIAGTFSGTVDFDPGPSTYIMSSLNSEAFICKLDPSGNFTWARKLNSSWALMNYHKTDATGNIYSTGAILSSNYDAFIWKLDALGNTIWMKQMGGSSSDNAIDIEVDIYGNVYTTGVFDSPDFDFDPGPGTYTLSGTNDGYISKLDGNGNFLWGRKIDNTTSGFYPCIPWNVISDGSGIYFCGQFGGVSDIDPGPATYTIATPGGIQNNGFVAKWDTAGNFLWGGSFPDLKDNVCYRVLPSSSGIYISGWIDSIADLDPGTSTYTINSLNGSNYIAKLNLAGTLQWVKQSYVGTRELMRDTKNNLLIPDAFWGTVDFDPSPAVVTLTNSSNNYNGVMQARFKWTV